MQTSNLLPPESQSRPPRARAIIEFVEGDLSRPPVVYPATGGSDEQDEALRREILKRWNRG
jgi:hypothetical protein